MNHLGVFIAGVAVALIVAAALGLLVWGAILDGRDEARRRARRRHELHQKRADDVKTLTDRVPPHAA